MLDRWKSSASPGFTFVLKARQEITHQAQLAGCGREIEQMVRDDLPLGRSLGCILFQLPPSLQQDLKLLSQFIHLVAEHLQGAEISPCLGFEFRHASWNTAETLALLTRLGCTMVLHDMPRAGDWRWDDEKLVAESLCMRSEELLEQGLPLLYLRFHGTKGMYAGKYGAAGLAPWSELARSAIARSIPVHAYFNNTSDGAAIADALEFSKQVGQGHS
jgi:uncharacterized protein YecE (DUF72 family)